jgi:hypothetical protein
MHSESDTERPVPFALERRIHTHPLHIGMDAKVKLRSVHPQWLAGWNALIRQVGSDRTAAKTAKVPPGFHREFKNGWEAARALMLTLHDRIEVNGSKEPDPVTETILEWRKRRDALSSR